MAATRPAAPPGAVTVVARAEGALMADELQQLVEHHLFGGPAPKIDGIDQVPMER